MPTRSTVFAPGEYYHLCNRSNDRKPIFLNRGDYARFLLLTFLLQSPNSPERADRHTDYFLKDGKFRLNPKDLEKMTHEQYVEIAAFALMDNHFHILVKENSTGGVSKYMQRLLNAYTKYFNTKYDKTGHLFQGPFRSTHIENNEQLLYVSAYIHQNPRTLPGFYDTYHNYEWSSYKDYLGENRWGELLSHEIILDQFDNIKDYQSCVDESGAKDIFDPLA